MAVSPSWITLPERYRIVAHIANGGMASVWEAHDELLGRDVAVKVLAPHLSEDEGSRRRFMREARTAAVLSTHPHVVTIYDVGEYEGRSFIVMELLRGGTVADRLRRCGRLEPATALRWLDGSAGALDAAHERGIVHRDVKPANLLLDEKERLAIADFGIARLALEDQLTATGIVLGTGAYIAPEQARGDESTAASDRYALAVVAFEMLTGSRPFQAEHFAAQARMHAEDPVPAASARAQLPPGVDAVLERGMAKDPGERWESATALVDALRGALESTEAPTAATTPMAGAGVAPAAAPPRRTAPPPPPRPAPPASGGSRRVAWLALAALAATAIALAVLLNTSPGGEEPAGQAEQAEQAGQAESPGEVEPEAPPADEAPPPEETPQATPAPASDGDLREARRQHLAGFAANNEGDHERGLELSLEALETCGDQRSLDPCGFALYETGRALVALGREEEAIPYLERRLDTYGDNRAGDVRQLLDEARGEGGNRGRGGDDD
jgi:eukaryotic-like serine/threonine-protein kinase